MRLAIIDHLQAMFDRAEKSVSVGQRGGRLGIDPVCACQRRNAAKRISNAKGWIAPAMDQLVNLNEKFGF